MGFLILPTNLLVLELKVFLDYFSCHQNFSVAGDCLSSNVYFGTAKIVKDPAVRNLLLLKCDLFQNALQEVDRSAV